MLFLLSDRTCSNEGVSPAGRMQRKRNIQIIEWEDLDKRKFYSFGVFMTMAIRATVYPATLIRTRLQVQRGKSLYSGTFDAFFKILRAEGVRGLYRGFVVNTFTLISGQAYITTYELVRKYVSQYSENNTVKSLVAGGSASLVAQSITVPIDVVSQQLMMQGQGKHLTRFRLDTQTGNKSVFGQTRNIMAQIFAVDGFSGFYRGYVASLLTYIPNSAVWWPFYHFYAGKRLHVYCGENFCYSWEVNKHLVCFILHRATIQNGSHWLSSSDPASHGWTSSCSYSLHCHQPDGCGQSSSTG